MMHYLDVQVELQTYVDGGLRSERAALLEQHIASCGACRAKLERLQAVVTALETWPVVLEPPDLAARVMAQVRTRPALPAFRLRWSDFAISLVGAGAIFGAALAWYYLTSDTLDYLRHSQMSLWLEMLRLEILLTIQHLVGGSVITWGLLLLGVVLTIVLALAAWNLSAWQRNTIPV